MHIRRLNFHGIEWPIAVNEGHRGRCSSTADRGIEHDTAVAQAHCAVIFVNGPTGLDGVDAPHA